MLPVHRIRCPSCCISQIQITSDVGYGTVLETGWYISDDFWVLSEAAELISERNFQFLLHVFTLGNCEPFHLRGKTVIQKNIF